MRRRAIAATATLILFSGLAAMHAGRGAEPVSPAVAPPAESPPEAKTPAPASDAFKTPRVSVDVARDRAQLMHDVYTSTLDMLHHRYFRADKAVIPARAMEDVFDDMKQSSSVEARWISVNLPAMGVDHEPETDFEKQAAKRIAAGESTVETVADGYYRRAGAISLHSGCISCHGGFFRTQSTTPKYAAVVISIPVHTDAVQR